MGLIACGVYSHLGRVFLLVVNQEDSLVVSLSAVNCQRRSVCTAEPLTFTERIKLMSQGIVEHDAHLAYLGIKGLRPFKCVDCRNPELVAHTRASLRRYADEAPTPAE